MDKFPHDIIRLLYRQVGGEQPDASEKALLEQWADESNHNYKLLQDIQDESQLQIRIAEHLEVMQLKEAAWEKLQERMGPPVQIVQPNPAIRKIWIAYAAAAIIVLATGIFCWKTLLFNPGPALVEEPGLPKDIAPGGNRATLTLADGSRILLDSMANGELAAEGNSRIMKTSNGQLEYADGNTNDPGKLLFNTLSTPKGGQYQLTLADGTKVWLNAVSSISYPASFTGKTREVTITGEAYFEVKANAAQPFIVRTADDEITVLGTAFNINAYEEEGVVKTSLAEGDVRVHSSSLGPGDKKGKLLHPGQAYINGRVTDTDIARDLAWKNGYFSFNNADIKLVMRQLARWYDVDIVYEGNLPEGDFNGRIGRGLQLSKVLAYLEAYDLNFRIDKKKVIVSRK